MIRLTVERVLAAIPEGSLELPPEIIFKRPNFEDTNWGDNADPRTDTVQLTASALRLSKLSLEAMVAHEVTHLIVFRNFKMPSGQSLTEFVRSIDNMERQYLVVQPHTSSAELLCDLMGVMVTKSPTVYRALFAELPRYWPLVVAQKFRKEADEPKFGTRDFSVSFEDPGWLNYRPRVHVDHNVFNQIRAYLWQRWLTRLPAEMHGQLFSKVLEIFGQLYRNGAIERLWYVASNGEVNKLLIDHLEKELSASFETPKR